MDQKEQAHLRKIMVDKIASLEEEWTDLKSMSKPQGFDSAIGRKSRMDHINKKSINEHKCKNRIKDHGA
ncbi:hypothetical protein [Pararhodonellum marinum]|uniref:hypothetical protein n=1 Tax=Pararhodonellum marinum TaxID=2755358 RepID=UPI00188E2569|nr:hypothetical protein [Pararhodonellum marinum]